MLWLVLGIVVLAAIALLVLGLWIEARTLIEMTDGEEVQN